MKYLVNFELELKKNPYPGKFIVIEGLDAAGKTTHVELLKAFIAKTHPIFVTKNPTAGEMGQFIRRALRQDFPTNPVAMQYLFSADRAIHQEEVIEHLQKNEVVLLDRYFWSSLAYGLIDKPEVDFDHEEEPLLVSLSILSTYHQFIVPDLTVYIDISAETAVERLSKLHEQKEVYDDLEALKRAKKAYEWVNHKFEEYIVTVSGEPPIAEVEADIEKEVEKVLKG